jgi:hypothetical protein
MRIRGDPENCVGTCVTVKVETGAQSQAMIEKRSAEAPRIGAALVQRDDPPRQQTVAGHWRDVWVSDIIVVVLAAGIEPA